MKKEGVDRRLTKYRLGIGARRSDRGKRERTRGKPTELFSCTRRDNTDLTEKMRVEFNCVEEAEAVPSVVAAHSALDA
jgi:hypothetical protein